MVADHRLAIHVTMSSRSGATKAFGSVRYFGRLAGHCLHEQVIRVRVDADCYLLIPCFSRAVSRRTRLTAPGIC